MKKLRARIIIYVGAALLLGMGVYCFIGIRTNNAQLLDDRVRILGAACDMMEQTIKRSMSAAHRDELKLVIETVGRIEGIESIGIIGEKGRIYISSDPEKNRTKAVMKGRPLIVGKQTAGKSADSRRRLRIFNADGGYRAVGMTVSIKNDEGCWKCHNRNKPTLGDLDMVISIADVEAKVAGNRNMAIVFGLLTILLVSAAVSIFVQYSIFPNIRRIIEGTERIHSGEYGYSIPVGTEDEIAWLARSFNRMSLRLKKNREEETEKWKQEMEEKVKRATADLEKANQQLTKAVEDLEKTEKVKTDLTMVIYHDLRSPLAAIQSCIWVVLEEITGEINPKQRDMLRRASEDIDKLLAFITNLLDLSQIEVTTVVSRLRPTQLSDILKSVAGSFAARAGQNGLTLSYNTPPELPLIYADRNHMDQVFKNLIGNAIKYTKPGGTVKVEAEAAGGFVKITVADTGIGIPEEALPRIFDIFYRAPNAKAMENVGTGLGLSIVKRIIHDHWGTITVDSREGEGSVFTIKLPRAEQV